MFAVAGAAVVVVAVIEHLNLYCYWQSHLLKFVASRSHLRSPSQLLMTPDRFLLPFDSLKHKGLIKR